jgi:hypothetical protein
LLKSELSEIEKKAKEVLKYYNDNLTVNSEFVKKFNENIPKDFEAKSNYFDNHKSTIFVNNLTFCEIYFGEYTDFDWANMNFEQLEKLKISWNVQTEYHLAKNNYLTDNNTFAVFCAEIIRFIEKLNITDNAKTQPETSTPDEVKNPYPDIFKNADYYKKFLEYSKKHIIDAHKDYSYLKKRMQKDKFIFRISDNEFYDFLINKIKVKEKRLIEIYTKEKKFYSQKKSNSEHRLNNYNIVFEIE